MQQLDATAENPKVPQLQELLSDSRSLMTNLELLIIALKHQTTRHEACGVLHQFSHAVQANSSPPLSIHSMSVPGSEEPIRLFLHTAVFAPEYWGRTFAEGLLKDPELFDGKKVVELGTGSGWISLVLLKRTRVKEILGLDINPVAVLMAHLNIWLNGTDENGEYKLSQAGIAIPEAFDVDFSDLLSEPLGQEEQFDHIIGCIPQVLHPDPEASQTSNNRSEKDLYDLSNYCFQQGILEDRFGLPLIASALEQAQLCLKPGGRVTLILGGRPGPAAIDAMFRRRGFEPNLIWSRRIQQADDTDLASLVVLERLHGIQFHFFMSEHSDSSVSASTAVRILEQGKPIYHDLLVYQAQTRFEKATTGFLNNLYSMDLDPIRRELDFSRITEEQISFMERLTHDMLQSKTLPYPHERGDKSLREKLSRFLHVYCHSSISPENLFVGPDRGQLLQAILSMVTKPGQRVLLSHSLDAVYRNVLTNLQLDIISGNDDLSELLALDNLLSPSLCLIAPEQLDLPSPIILSVLSTHAKAHPGRWYLIDDSKHFDIHSSLGANMFLRLTSQENLPSNMVLLYGLIKNIVCPDLELSFLINAPQHWLEGLDAAAELSYSRIAYLTQLYYEWLFDELLAFPLQGGADSTALTTEPGTNSFVNSFQKVVSDPVFAPKPVDVESPDLIRLDYGEFEHPVPDLLVKGIIKGFLETPADGISDLVIDRIASYVEATRQSFVDPERIVLGEGVFPLLGNLIRTMAVRLGRAPIVALPSGSYGLFYPLIAYHGGSAVQIDTDPAAGFLLNVSQIASVSPKPDLLILTQPNNPSGLFFAPEVISAIMQLCAQKEIYVLADEIFFLLSDYQMGSMTPPNFSFGSSLQSAESRYLFLTDGLSKSFAAGGARCGFMICPDGTFARDIQSLTAIPPKATLRAWDTLYSAFLEEAPHQLMDIAQERQEIQHYLDDARTVLDGQRQRLLSLLKEHKLDDGLNTKNRGGLFVLAKLACQHEALAQKTGLLINPDNWSRTPGWSRICFSLTPERFEAAMERLKAHLK